MSDIIEPDVTLDQQFIDFAKMSDPKGRDGKTIDLYMTDYWMRQAGVLNDRVVTTTDTGIAFFKFEKTEINYEEFEEYLKDLAETKHLILDDLVSALCKCGLPGTVPVRVPQYREYFLTWKPKNRLMVVPDDPKKY
ncbi:tubulin polymerization-promoting protein homolog [Plodia interpunctella]|uniref:tubulin polymerization-promoting protein homolog n=1 Tax=Plodia interpunctella TaxID=58824 RepID=UPI002367CBB8|nr:tubulin polymerization-promoting protein homolog isoform X2 [Plodia interpunctella]